MKVPAALVLLALALAGCSTAQKTGPDGLTRVEAPAAPRVGDAWAYRVSNGYSKTEHGIEHQRVVEVTPEHVVVEASGLRSGRWTLTPDLRWIAHPLADDRPRTFDPPYPALVFPLAAGASWRARVAGRDTATGTTDRVTVQASVRGWQRITVPAGTYDTLRIRRLTWGGNFNHDLGQSEITEDLWYAPSIDRIVRHESQWRQLILYKRAGQGPVYHGGDWLVRELLPAP